jgi:hypothetical protein
MKRYFLISFITILGAVESKAQVSNQVLFNDQENLQKISKGGGGYYANNPTSNDIDGSPFLFNSMKARIVSKDKAVFEIPVIYDAYNDVFIVDNKGVKVELNEKRIDSILVENQKFITLEGGYYAILSSSNISFYKKYKAEILRSDYVPALNTGNKNRRWKINNLYFLMINSVLTPVTLTKSSIQNVLNLNKEQLADIQKKGYKFTRESDVVLILQNLSK